MRAWRRTGRGRLRRVCRTRSLAGRVAAKAGGKASEGGVVGEEEAEWLRGDVVCGAGLSGAAHVRGVGSSTHDS